MTSIDGDLIWILNCLIWIINCTYVFHLNFEINLGNKIMYFIKRVNYVFIRFKKNNFK